MHIGRVLKNCNIPYEYYLTKSRKAKNYKNDNDISNKWVSFKENTYTIKSLYWMAKTDNVKLFKETLFSIYKTNNINSLFDIEKYEQLKINKKYLLNGDKDDEIIKNILKNGKHKILNH